MTISKLNTAASLTGEQLVKIKNGKIKNVMAAMLMIEQNNN